jgi:capsular exopolysaccharide synthesis family protein
VESEFAQLQTAYGDSVQTFESLRVAEARGLNTLTVVEPAIAPTEPVRPNRTQTIALAVLAGLATAAASAWIFEYLDDGLPTRERLARATGLRALGTIPSWRSSAAGLVVTLAGRDPRDRNARRAADAYRHFFGSLMLARAETGTGTEDPLPMAIMVTSAGVEEGKSVTAANLAAAFAETGRRVILVDADVHRPSQMRRFELPNSIGLSTLLLNPSVELGSMLRETSMPCLRVLTSGPEPAAASAVYTSRHLDARLAELRQQSDVIVFDTPPVLAQPDIALLGQHVSGVLLVVDARKSHARQVRRALELLSEAGVPVWGAALNRVSPRAMDYIPPRGYERRAAPETTEAAPSSSTSVRAARGQAS